MDIIIVLLVITLIFILLKTFQIVGKSLMKKNKFFRNLERYYSLIISIIWPGVIFWAINYLFFDNPFYKLLINIVLVITIGLFGWFFLKDFIAGFVFKIQNRFNEGDFVELGEFSGQVDSILLTHIVLVNEIGKTTKIPYSRLSNEVISLNEVKNSFEDKTFIIETHKKNNASKTKEVIEKFLLFSPWKIVNSNFVVKILEENESTYKFELKVQVSNTKHANYIIDALEKKVGIKE